MKKPMRGLRIKKTILKTRNVSSSFSSAAVLAMQNSLYTRQNIKTTSTYKHKMNFTPRSNTKKKSHDYTMKRSIVTDFYLNFD